MLAEAFPAGTLHALAVKANPLVAVLREAVGCGAGLEAASLEEVHLSLAAGCPPSKIVFDSPAKTPEEIEEALRLGLLLNANDFSELDRIAQVLKTRPSDARIGLRINPEVGTGLISHTSVGQTGSKFGVSISRHDREILDAFTRYGWLVGLHSHVGSQGCELEMLTTAAAKVDDLRQRIEATIRRSLSFVDIGGGLPTVYRSDQTAPTPEQYVRQLRRETPQLLSGPSQLVTEFGRAVQAGCGVAFSRVEYVRPEQQMAVLHVGADLLLRPVYRPEDWQHEYYLLDPQGRPKSGAAAPVTLAGPLCFSGDIIAREVSLPAVNEGDWVAIRDTGAYTLSMWSRHCSRGLPVVLGYDDDASESLRVIRAAETPADLVRFWGG